MDRSELVYFSFSIFELFRFVNFQPTNQTSHPANFNDNMSDSENNEDESSFNESINKSIEEDYIEKQPKIGPTGKTIEGNS